MHRSRAMALVLVGVLSLLAGACGSSGGGSDAGDTGSSSTPTLSGSAGTAVPLGFTHAALSVVLPTGLSVQHDEPVPTSGGCTSERSTVDGKAQSEVVAFNLVAAACSTGKPQGKQGNGGYGSYVSLADVTDPVGAKVTAVPVGKVTVFDERRYLCTNSCKDVTSTIGLVQLSHPSDPAYPSVMIISGDDGSQRAQVLAAAQRLRTP